MKLTRTLRRLAAAALASVTVGPAIAQTPPPGLPATLAWSAYDVGSGGYNQAVAIGNALKQRYGVNLRVLPGKNDVSRTLPVREGQVQFSANGVGGSYLAQEGVFEFGAKSWGPQPIRGLLLNNSDQVLTVVAAKDSGIKTVADLKGKRVAWVIGAPSLNQNITAILAFANLSWNDVQRVDFGGFGAAMDGVINGQADAAFTSSISGKAYQLAKSPRGIVYPVIPHADKAGWARMNKDGALLLPLLGRRRGRPERRQQGRVGVLPLPDPDDLRPPGRRHGLRDDQGDGRDLPRLQGRRTGQRRLGGRAPELRLGHPLPRWRDPLLEGARPVEARAPGAQRQAGGAPEGAGRRLESGPCRQPCR
jgi:uncharacterized protein